MITHVMIKKSDSSPTEAQCWSIVIYKVPSTPSTARVTVWKKVKELGALPLQQSVYILPKLPVLVGALDELKKQIEGFGGECKILEMASLEGVQEKEMINGFNTFRNQEYEEILDECEAFDQEIDKETKAGKYYFAEEEEIEKKLDGLNVWFNTVTKRDFFHAEFRAKVVEKLNDCRERLDSFSQEVFTREQATAGESKPNIHFARVKTESSDGKKRVRETYSKEQLKSRLKEIVRELETNTLKIGDEQVGISAEECTVEIKYRVRDKEKSLGIDIEWQER
jgi:amphi-Trp domain-containing protein